MKILFTALCLSLALACARKALPASILSPRPNNTPLTGLQQPFVITRSVAASVRFQQVYAASDFQAVSPGAMEISGLAFESVFGSNPIDVTLPNVAVHLSTTSKPPDGLSGTFSDNIGADDSVVFSGSLHLVGNSGSGFSMQIPMLQPFLYNPSAGNLLMDVFNYQTIEDPPSGAYAMGSQCCLFDSASIVSAFNVNATQASGGGSGALVTLFSATPVPEPAAWAITVVGGLLFAGVRLGRKNTRARR